MFSKNELINFNELEFEVYNFILNNSDKIPYMTIRELAQEAHVSTTTITRFCKKLNCKGFSEFKIRFKISKENRENRLLNTDATAITDFLKRASTTEFLQDMDKISEILEKAKTLIFIGNGNSGVMAKYAARYFSSVGKFALHVENPMFGISLENPLESVIIVFSVSGEGDALISNVSSLKGAGVTIVSVTNSKNSTISKLSDLNIAHYVQYEFTTNDSYKRIDITTQFPAVYIIETLAKKTYNIKHSK